MKIIYIISLFLLIIQGTLIRRTEKKLNIFIEIPKIIVIYMCYISFLAYIFYLLNIKINSITVGCINIIIAIIIGAINIRRKQLQEYCIEKKDLFFISVFIMASVFIIYNFFGNFNKVKYLSDGLIHYTAAREFSVNERLFKQVESKTISINPVHMPLAYVNEGLLMNSLQDYIGQVNTLKVFLMVDAFAWCMCGYLLFFILKDKIKGKLEYVIAVLISIIYFLGYPLNAMITGFHYLNFSIMIIATILLMYKKEKVEIPIFLLNLGVMFTYNLFVPVVYGAEFIWYIVKNRKNFRKIMYYIVITLIIPGIIGIHYYFLAQNAREILDNGIIQEGYILRNEWSNFIVFLPFSIYAMYRSLKKNNIVTYMFAITLIEAILIIIANQFGKISTYYYYKMYYLFQLILMISTFYGIKTIVTKNDKIKYISIIFLIIYITVALYDCKMNENNVQLRDKTLPFESDNLSNITKVYRTNRIVFNQAEKINLEQIETLKYIENYLKKGDNILYINTQKENLGFYVIFRDIRNYNDENIKKWNEKKQFDYLVIFEEKDKDIKLKNIELDEQNKIYENENTKIYKN